jgi:hypothetical protein
MNESTFVILGGGMVAGYAAQELVERGLKPGDLTIFPPTLRPHTNAPSIKRLLTGKRKRRTQFKSVRVQNGSITSCRQRFSWPPDPAAQVTQNHTELCGDFADQVTTVQRVSLARSPEERGRRDLECPRSE